mmetsp:Transcript_36002/g.69560  ORF Transcript_36002/g.69560 Transcript_36002/m.69560 type:complete len:101 (+) Transcript_36002:273-575(+)
MIKVFGICLACFMVLTVLYYYMGLFARDVDGGTQMARISVDTEESSIPSKDSSSSPGEADNNSSSKESKPPAKDDPPETKPPPDDGDTDQAKVASVKDAR